MKITRQQAIALLSLNLELDVRSALVEGEDFAGLSVEDIPDLIDGVWGGEDDHFELWTGGKA